MKFLSSNRVRSYTRCLLLILCTLAATALRADNPLDDVKMSGTANQVTSTAVLTVMSGGNVTIASGGTFTYATGAIFAGNAGEFRTDIGLGSIATQAASSVTITGGSITGITDLAVADGGTGASTAANARTNLGLVIGTHVQAWDADLDTWSTKTPYAGNVVVTTGKSITVSNTLTLTATDGSTLAIGTGGTLGTAAYTASTAYATAAQGTKADAAGAVTGIIVSNGSATFTGRTLTGSGLATLTNGSGVSGNPTVDVPAASNAETITGTSTAKAVVPAGDKAALDARMAALIEREGLRFTNGYAPLSNGGIPAIGSASDFTLITFIKRASGGGSFTAVPVAGSSTASLGVSFSTGGTGYLELVNSGVGSIASSSPYSLPIGGKACMAFRRASGTVNILADGIVVGTPVTGDTTNFTSPTDQLGAVVSDYATYGFSGSLARTLFFNYALTDSEIQELINRGLVTLPEQRGGSMLGNTDNFVTGDFGQTYTTFTGVSSTGFTAAVASGTARAVMRPLLKRLNALPSRRVLLKFTATLNSGATPRVQVLNSGGNYINVGGATGDVIVNGANTITLTMLTGVGATNQATDDSNYLSIYTSGASDFSISGMVVVLEGTLFEMDAAQRNAGYQLKDTSGARRDVTIPATGVAIIDPDPRGGNVRGTLTWSGTHEAKSLLGQIALPSNARVTNITTTATTASSGSGLTLGTTNSATRWVAINTYSTGVKIHTVANSGLPAGTASGDLDIVLDPDTANYTGTINVSVDYTFTN